MSDLRKAAEQVLRALDGLSEDGICQSSHHANRDRHTALEVCPVYCRVLLATTDLRAALAQQAEPQWIACSERMPEQGLAVLIIDIDGDHDIGRWDGTEWFTFSRNAYAPSEVKHWMPLPAAPGKGGA